MASLTRRALLASAMLLAPAARLRGFAAPISLDQFIEVSQRLLGRSKLDREVAQIYLDAVLSNADDAITLAYLVESNNNPTPEMKALASTIIEWWYRHLRDQRRVSTRHAHRRADVVRAWHHRARNLRDTIRRMVQSS